ncbi:zinc finger protein 436-like [Cheilinus undulatus]|uniref:zinc finger protein 436-like n=1 Tax=Cheilinus undulatus TaxID=241271 RepID=UPI001BD67233|nr:zinc finger protein 436-like [Cheilinus undulatus]
MEGVNVMFGSPVNFMDYQLSKAEILRGIVTEKLTTAAREIFAVVERTVAGYEEEAAGLRQEIDRQRIQLEAILQPRVSLSRIDDREYEEEVDWEGDLSEDEETQGENSRSIFGPAEFAAGSLGPLYHDGTRDPDYKTANTKPPPLKRRNRKRASLNIRVCLLQDSKINILKRGALKSQLKEVKCPPGLQEADFLNLLRSSFPQLTGEFETFTMDSTRRLTQLNLQTLTPEVIERSIKSTGKGRSALYIRVKGKDEPLSSPEQLSQALITDNTIDDSGSEEKPHVSFTSPHSPEGEEERNQSEHLSENLGWQQQTEEDEEQGLSEDLSALYSDNSAGDSGDDDDEDEEWKPNQDKDLKETTDKPQTKRVTAKRRKQIQSTDESGAPLSCKVCKALTGTKNILIKHSWCHVEDPERLCGVCGEQSGSQEELMNHLESHKKTYSCEVCGKKFLSNFGLQTHAPLHTGEKPFKCDICSKAFVFRNALRQHKLEHVEDKPYKCDVCSKSFALKAKLKIHSRTHTGEKPFTCELCGKSFSDSGPLARHKLTHFGEKRFGCQVCGRHFFTPREVNFHMRIHTVREKPFLCDICCKSFYTQGHLNEHLKIHSNKKFKCSVCGKDLSSKGGLRRHMMVHTGDRPYKCLECGRTYTSSSHLRFHLKLHLGIKSFVCQVCGKAFLRKEALNNHMRTHDGEKPHKCTICGRGFTQSHSMKTHMKRHQAVEKAAVDVLMD